MPYSTVSELPDSLKALPAHAKEIYMKAFNSAFEQYDGDEPKSHGTAWAAVKKVFKKVAGGKWVAKESKVKEALGELSDENKRTLLQAGLIGEYKIGTDDPTPRGVWIQDIFENYLIYEVNGQSYKATYTLDKDGTATFGEPEKVVAQKIYKPMESLQSAYSEIIHEASRRNASLDSARLQKIVALCQELLSSEIDPDAEKAKEALKEANSALEWILEQAAMKTEDGVKYPAAAYAYVPDKEKSSTWKLWLWESLDKKVTRAQLGRAAAALSPGGFKGQKVQIPVSELSAVKRKIRTEYRKLDVEDEDIPRWVKETMTRELVRNYVPLTEATFDKGRATVIIIRPGPNADKSRYYPIEMLKRDYGVFEGQKMYADHPTETEEKELPERSIKNTGWVAVLKDVTCDENGVVTGVAEIIEPWLMTKLAMLRDKNLLSEMGISINAIGRATEATIDGGKTLVIEELTGCRSVDFVTEPGASGIVTLYESDRRRDVDLVDLATLKEKRPDLIKVIEADVRAEITTEVKKAMEDKEKIVELEGTIETLTGEKEALQTKVTEGEKDKAKADAKAIIEKAVADATLPPAAKERLVERFKDAESADGIEEAIKSEVEYIGKLGESGKVKGLGPSKASTKEDHKALKESFKANYLRDGKSEKEAEELAEIAANAR